MRVFCSIQKRLLCLCPSPGRAGKGRRPCGTIAQQTVNLALDTIRLIMEREEKRGAAELQLHSDQGFLYTSQAYFSLTKQYNITPSLSGLGNLLDNAMSENFFSILKTKCIYQYKPAAVFQSSEMIDR